MIDKIKEWWSRQTSTTQAFLALIIFLIIGIIIRWDFIMESIGNGFEFFKFKK
jgi:hypothetical protein